MDSFFTNKTIAQEIKEKFNHERLNKSAWEDSNYAFEYATYRAVENICDLLDNIIRGKLVNIGNGADRACNVATSASTMTWAELNRSGSPSMAEGNPCPPGTKILAINQKTKEFKIINFDPDTLTIDWDIAYSEDKSITDKSAKNLAVNLLAMMGWNK